MHGSLITYSPVNKEKILQLPFSKSECNRALVLAFLSGAKSEVKNISDAEDTVLMQRLLKEMKENGGKGAELDCRDAGTAARFLTAVCAVTPGTWKLYGTERMHMRPIGPLVKALLALGANIEYEEEEGFLPLLIKGNDSLPGKEVSILAAISSQYISALLMIGAKLPGGLQLQLKGNAVSRDYIELTRQLMLNFGVKSKWVGNQITIPRQAMKDATFITGADWSAASYFYAYVALTKQPVFLGGLTQNSAQGDKVCLHIFKYVGVETEEDENGCRLTYRQPKFPARPFTLNLGNYPDLAPALVVCFAIQGLEVDFSGLEHLKIKESDRVEVMAEALKNYGISLQRVDDRWELRGSFKERTDFTVDVAGDHRMAMAFSLLSIPSGSVSLNDTDCVKKSFPRFWEEAAKLGLEVGRQWDSGQS